MPVNLASISQLLKPGLAGITGGAYDEYPAQWSELYQVFQSDKSVEQVQEIRMLSVAQIKAEGTALAFDNNLGTRSTAQYYNRAVAIGYIMTREALSDNLYKTRFPLANRSLKRSMDQAKELLGASLFNNGYDANFPIYDGQPLFSVNHPIDGGVVANTPAIATDLSEQAIESGITSINGYKDAAGLKVQVKPKKLVVNSANQWVAQRLLGSAFRTQTANNDISAIYTTDAIPGGYKVNQFLTPYGGNSNVWFILNDVPGLRHFVREKLEVDMYSDFSTKSIEVSAFERYCFGCDDFRTVYGSHA